MFSRASGAGRCGRHTAPLGVPRAIALAERELAGRSVLRALVPSEDEIARWAQAGPPVLAALDRAEVARLSSMLRGS